MSTKIPFVIAHPNLSVAWSEAFLRLMAPGNGGLTPLFISTDGFEEGLPIEDPKLRELTDGALAEFDRFSVRNTAQTIFPQKFWLAKGQPPAEKFAEWYRRYCFPHLYQAAKQNRGGTYFQRMVGYGAEFDKKYGYITNRPLDQLSAVIDFWKKAKGPRRSALQVSCFDPQDDHHFKARCGFPCLHQVSFSYDDDDGLAVTGYYPSEYIFDRGYGNYLGLCHLGHFVAQEVSRRLVRMNCVVAHPILAGERAPGVKIGKEDLRSLQRGLLARLAELKIAISAPTKGV